MPNPTQITGSELDTMNHPSREQWMSYLYDELPRAAKADLAAHLRTCALCQMDMTVWQSAKGTLGAWKLTRPRHVSAAPLSFSVFKWAMAALVILGLGFTIGRFALVQSETEGLRAALAPELKAALLPALKKEVQEELQADYQAVLAGGPQATSSDFRRQLRALLADSQVKAVTASTAHSDRALLEFAENYRTDRAREQQDILALFDRTYLNLRRAVETVAVVADDNFQRTQNQLGQLASYTQAKFVSDSPPKAQ